MKNYYDLLEVTPKASKEIIEKAYKVLIKKYHPDLYSGEERIYAENKTRDLNEAYRILTSDFLREQYDLELEKEKSFSNNNYNEKNIKNIKNTKNTKNQKSNFDDNSNQSVTKEEKQHKVGTIMSMVDLIKEIFKKRKKGEHREIKKEDKIAALLTLIIVIVLGVILWFIPATNGFIRDIIPF